MTTLDEKTKITLPSAGAIIGFVACILGGYFYTQDEMNDRILALEKDQTYAETYRKDTKERFDKFEKKQDDFNSNQVKIMVALGVEPEKQAK